MDEFLRELMPDDTGNEYHRMMEQEAIMGSFQPESGPYRYAHGAGCSYPHGHCNCGTLSCPD